MARSSTNLLQGTSGEYIYFVARNNRYLAQKRFLEEPNNPLNTKCYLKSALLYTFEEAQDFIKALPLVLPREHRYDRLINAN